MATELIFVPPTVVPAGWRLWEKAEDGYKWHHEEQGTSVIVSWAKEEDEKTWVHFSMACAARVPNWEELKNAKEVFLGVESKAVLVIPPRSEYVNINARVLHLFVCLDENPLPDFTRGGGML